MVALLGEVGLNPKHRNTQEFQGVRPCADPDREFVDRLCRELVFEVLCEDQVSQKASIRRSPAATPIACKQLGRSEMEGHGAAWKTVFKMNGNTTLYIDLAK